MMTMRSALGWLHTAVAILLEIELISLLIFRRMMTTTMTMMMMR